jgi:F0F1-type ATP synthase membrane subunit c/vacuolar-type H+-ATPase subunit K
MAKITKHFLLLFLLSVLTFIVPVVPIFAQTPTTPVTGLEGAATLGVAHIVEMQDKKIKDGSVISSGKKGAVPTIVPYDSQVLGVVSRDAAIILDNAKSDENGVPVISTGAVYILVSSKDGNIKKGDLLATTTLPGVAAKAVKDGFVLGSAMEDFSSNDPKKIDKIAVNLDLHYFNSKPTFPGTLSDIFKLVLLPTKDGPNPIFKYVMAAIVVLGSMILGFMSFGRAAAKGVEALGRNPAASRIIHLGIIFNVAIVVAIALAGLGVAFLILRL